MVKIKESALAKRFLPLIVVRDELRDPCDLRCKMFRNPFCSQSIKSGACGRDVAEKL
ncbi:hypothetical protein HGP14_13240 [Rhizobium sp. P32RR-XVIII]|uniref:hypothetical protein n=1 Tax=Rhizobium sp. P32RR-XVIII TaxID=2726738 RepID=UPI0014565A79|nr:hypothetical protein [Rhizobium sp. P32RR-XVIII]NLS04320.1 hypothetical protein [Rhizobium sp. P32RR-XVIII]